MPDTRMTECHIDREHYAWYRDLRRCGTVPHAGFGLCFRTTCRGMVAVDHLGC